MKRLVKTFEESHHHVKRRFVKYAGFQIFLHASRTLKGIETIYALYTKAKFATTELRFFDVQGITTITNCYLTISPHLSTRLYFFQTLKKNSPRK